MWNRRKDLSEMCTFINTLTRDDERRIKIFTRRPWKNNLRARRAPDFGLVFVKVNFPPPTINFRIVNICKSHRHVSAHTLWRWWKYYVSTAGDVPLFFPFSVWRRGKTTGFIHGRNEIFNNRSPSTWKNGDHFVWRACACVCVVICKMDYYFSSFAM